VTAIGIDERWLSDACLRMPFDQYERYRLTAELVRALRGEAPAPARVLDVGGFFRNARGAGELPLLAFLPDDDVTTVDRADFAHPRYRRTDGGALPFDDRAFDFVVSCDTLEHVAPPARGGFVRELRRVAGRAVILAAPHAADGVPEAERALAGYLRSLGMDSPMLREHAEHGLPEPAWLERTLRDDGAQFVTFPSGYLPRWQMMMMLKHQLFALPDSLELHERLDTVYNQRFYERDQRGPGYRRVYVIATAGAPPPSLEPFVARAARPEPEDAAADLLGLVATPLLRALGGARLDLLHRTVADQQALIAQLSARVEELQRQLAALEGRPVVRLMSLFAPRTRHT
jgi:SAM-dependent methyltransferase